MNKLLKYSLGVLGLILTLQVHAQEKLEKDFSESFSIEDGDLLDLENEYGKIIIKEVSGSELKIAVHVEAEGKDTESTQESLDRISVVMEKEGKVISAHTRLDAKANAFKSLVKSVGDAFNNNMNITYQVEVPKGLNLDVYQKNGDIQIADVSSDYTIELNDGELKLDKITGTLKLTLKGAEGTITSMEDGSLTLENSSLDVKSGKNIVYNSNVNGCKLNAGNLESLFLDSKNDEIKCLSLGGLSGKSTLSKINIEKLNGITDFNLSFGYISVEEVTSDMESISIEGKSNADIFMDFSKSLTFELELTGKEDHVKIPEADTELKKTTLNEKSKEAQWKGKVGSGDAENRTVILKTGGSGKIELGK